MRDQPGRTLLKPWKIVPIAVWACLMAPMLPGQAATRRAVELETGTVVERVVTLHDPEQQYAVYLPRSYSDSAVGDRTWPVLFVLDPRGRAVPGIERFLPAAERHGFVVISSYQSRSDTWRWVNTQALEALLRDGERRLRLDPRRMYLAGMSGTAHAAWRFAQELGARAAGVIACVGGVQDATQGPPGDASFAYYGITAPADFNYQEMLRLEGHMLESAIDHRIDFFDGRHGWSPHDHTNRALDWMQFQAIKRGLVAADETLVESQFQRALAAVSAATDPLEEARRRRDVVRDFAGLRGVSVHVEAIGKLEATRAYESRRAEERKLARRESTYFRHRLAGWLVEMRSPARPPTPAQSRIALRLDDLRRESADVGKPAEARSARRILESLFTTVAFDLPEHFERVGDSERSILSLKVAVEIDPSRSRPLWALAELYATHGRTDPAFEALRAATALGNVDVERLRRDPAWEPLHESPEWAELVETVERAEASASASDG